MTKMPQLHPLTLADQNLVSGYLHRYPPIISEHTFTNLFIWQPSRPIFFTEMENSLIFLVRSAVQDGHYILFGPPVGEVEIPDVFTAFAGKLIGGVRIPDREVENIPAAPFIIHEDRDNADYVYRVDDLAELAGRHYAKKRNHINQCLSSHTCEYVPITQELLSECETMQENWCNSRDCGRNPGLCNEANAIAETFAHFREFELLGGAIRVNGIIQAYAIAEKLHPGTAVWHFEKAMGDIQGLGQLINQWFSKYGLSGFEYVNREQDLGIPGMRQAKESYYPHHLVAKNCISLTSDQPITARSIKAEGCAAHEH
jgi:hypothetical protein